MALTSGAAGGLLARLEQAGGGAAPAVVSMTPTDQPTPPPRPTSGVAPSTPGPGPTLAPPRSSSPSPTPVPSPTPAPLVTYEVQPGDTLATIAAAHGTSVEALVAANDLASADVILPGQRLVITHSGG
jgi:LysM repeat protein